MPGIFGFVTKDLFKDIELSLQGMARALEADDRFQVDLFQEGGIGLGRSSLKIINPEIQPCWNETRTICLLLEGELYAYDSIKRDLIEKGHRFLTDSHAEFALHLYEEHGEGFASLLNGAFAMAIWNQETGELLALTDRIGQFPIYYAKSATGFIFASGVRAILSHSSVDKEIDPVGISEFLTFVHALEDTTFFKEIHRLPPGSLLVYKDGDVCIEEYWTLKNPEVYPLRDEREWIEDLLFHLKQAVARQVCTQYESGLLLSGGLDSRVLLAFLSDQISEASFTTLTWGSASCDDYLIAKQLSKKAGVDNKRYPLDPDWLIREAEEGVRITDGMGNVINLHAMSILPASAELPIVYKGFMGDGLFGYSMKHQHWATYDPATQTSAHLQVHREQGAILFEPEDHAALFSPDFYELVNDAAIDGYRQAMKPSPSGLLADERFAYGLRQRVPRMALNGVEVLRNQMFVRLPFCDNDLVEFAISVPPGLRYKRHLIKNALIISHPQFAKVPLTETGLPLMECARELVIRTEMFTRWHLNRRGLTRVQYPRKRPYADYNKWFRADLKEWMLQILMDPSFLNAGIFRPDFVQHLIRAHLSGEKHAGRLGALITIALWHKLFVG